MLRDACQKQKIRTWVNEDDVTDRSWLQQYAQAFYWAVSATTGQGQSVEPETHVELCYTIFAIILGVMLLTFIIGSATSVLANVDSGDVERWKYVLHTCA